MKYSIKQEVVDSKGNRGTVVNVAEANGRVFYQVLFDKDWSTGRADFIPEESLRTGSAVKWDERKSE